MSDEIIELIKDAKEYTTANYLMDAIEEIDLDRDYINYEAACEYQKMLMEQMQGYLDYMLKYGSEQWKEAEELAREYERDAQDVEDLRADTNSAVGGY